MRIIVSFLNQLFSLWLEMFHDKSITNSQLLSVDVTHDDTASGASCGWGVCVISWGAAGASVDEKGTASTHFARFLRLEIERARTLNSLVHDVDTGR